MDTSALNMSNPKEAPGLEAAVMVLLFLLLLGVGMDLGFQLSKKEEPPHTKAAFDQGYVPGCVLAPATFTFPDGATLSGDFAKCDTSEKTFTPATSVVAIPKKGDITVHTILENDGKSMYPVVTVFTPASADTPTEQEMKNGAAARLARQVNVVDVTTPGVIATSTSTGEALHSYAVIQNGYLMTLFTKGTSFSYDQGTLAYTPPQNLAQK